MQDSIKLGISACLLGHKVRYDGGHQHDHFITDTLGRFVDFVPVCPEAEAGLGIPREPMRLVGEPAAPRLITVRTKHDHTDRMHSWAQTRLKDLEQEGLCGFIFKSRSPSSGMERVKVYNEQGTAVNKGVGLFARQFMNRFPLLPVEDEGRLHDPKLRENFIERIFVFRRWRSLLVHKKNRGGLVEFHTAHKLLIMSHSEKHYRMLGSLVARAKEFSPATLFSKYETMLMEALRFKTTIKKNINVLLHLLGYFKKNLSADEKKELLEIIEQYRSEYVPLVVPITLINHYVRKYGREYLAKQYYLHPHPIEFKLRNHV